MRHAIRLTGLSMLCAGAAALAAEPAPAKGDAACTTGSLFAGNPLHEDPAERPKDGTGLLEDPPFPHRQLVFSRGQVFTHMGQEIWRASLADKKLHRVAGAEGGMSLISGPCAKARFANIAHLALASDGSLFVSDQAANAILKVVDPLGDGCTVVRWAGAPKDLEGGISPSRRPNQGNVDGPGDKAKLGTPQRLALDPKDNVYFWEEDNNTIRKVANDAAHTVTTFAKNVTEGSGAMISQTFMGGKLYVWGGDGSDTFLYAYDADGKKTKVLKGRADLFGGSSSDSRNMGGIVNDGTSLIVFFNKQLFRITPAGEVTAIAGDDEIRTDFTAGYDVKKPQPAMKVQLPTRSMISTAGLNAYLAIDGDRDLYLSARYTNAYVVKLDCK